MKILELRFKNLNSLYGEWFIDFSNSEYTSNGLFALTGPTGSGKSTILDAICLALYGETPRLGRITKSSNEIMSRQTGECYAEVMFESQAGRFRCHFSQHRARKKAEADLQSPRHEIAEGHENGKVIESQLRRVATVIEEKTGMDFERFTRSMLLAQGGFDTFLKADAEQKSRILEQITGTTIYSDISRGVHERQREEREKLNILQAETSGIVILDLEQLTEIQLDLEEKQQQEFDLGEKSARTNKAIAWLTSINGLKQEISDLADEALGLQRDIDAFKPERSKLDRAIQAASLEGAYVGLKGIRQQQSGDRKALQTEEAHLPELQVLGSELAESLTSAEQQTKKAKIERSDSAPLIQEVRSLDQQLAAQKNTVLEDEDGCRKTEEKIEKHQQAKLVQQNKRTEAQKNLESADVYLRKHAEDAWLISGLAGVEAQLGNLFSIQQDITQNQTDHATADTALERAISELAEREKQCGIHQQGLERASNDLQQGRGALRELLGKRLLREYRVEKESLLREVAFLSRIAELEDHRARLEDGKACPLCGAMDHPFAEGNIPVSDELDQKIDKLGVLIETADGLETANQERTLAVTTARNTLTESEKQAVTAVNDKKTAERSLAELMSSRDKLRATYIELETSVLAKLQPLGITEIPDDDVSSLIDALKTRLNTWQNQRNRNAEINIQIADIDSEMSRLEALIETHGDTLAEKQGVLARLKKVYLEGVDKRTELYGDKVPDIEARRMENAVTDAEQIEKQASRLNSEQQQKLNTAKTHVEALRNRIIQHDPQLKQAEAEFCSALVPAGFADEAAFVKARLTTGQLEALSASAKKLNDDQIDLKARQKDRNTRLVEETAKKLTDQALEALEPKLEECDASLNNLRDAIAGLKHKLSEDAVAKARIKEKQADIDAQKKECHRWEKLHGLIGSADGKKYRNFAQGLTFEVMVSHANRQLEKMTDRYLLIRDEQQPLELNVIDNDQAGEIRSTRNLSGGESFIVSLTLALGLSKMASRRVRVDSLFLDEGFGTLDEDALETALETLSGLQQDGKLIGIISHVSALKERISTQITVKPVSGGRSTLTGPGCSRVEN